MLKFNHILENVEGTTTSHLLAQCAIVTRPAKPGIDFKPSTLEKAEKAMGHPVRLSDLRVAKVIYQDGTWRNLGVTVAVKEGDSRVSLYGKSGTFRFTIMR